MKHFTLHSLFLLLIIAFIPAQSTNAAGLQEYLEKAAAEKTTSVEKKSEPVTSKTSNKTVKIVDSKATGQLTHIIEMVVAGVVASALIISLLVLFLGRWIAKKDRMALKALRQDAEQEAEHITAAVTTVREQEKETTKIIHTIREQATEIESKQDKINVQKKDIDATFDHAQKQQKELEKVTSTVGNSMTKIQNYWDEQLRDTVSTIQKVQSGLHENLEKVDDGLDKMQRQKSMSEQLMQDFLRRHNEQNTILENNSKISDQVSESLEETLKESTHLLDLLKKQQKDAEQALSHFNDELSGYEEQAYEQFDSSFQVADIARQELSANIEESRKHLESMRRYEEQSHGINVQTQKHLETLDFTKIVKLSHTLNSTQDMFTDLRDSVEEAQNMLDDLKDIETDVRETAISVKKSAVNIDHTDAENTETDSELAEATEKKSHETKKLNTEILPRKSNNKENEPAEEASFDYKLASGDNAPLSFFKHLKNNTANQQASNK